MTGVTSGASPSLVPEFILVLNGVCL